MNGTGEAGLFQLCLFLVSEPHYSLFSDTAKERNYLRLISGFVADVIVHRHEDLPECKENQHDSDQDEAVRGVFPAYRANRIKEYICGHQNREDITFQKPETEGLFCGNKAKA